MRINWIEIKNGDSYILKKCEFSDFTLLVGKTGVGKSEILNTLYFYNTFFDNKFYNDYTFIKFVLRNISGLFHTISFSIDENDYVYKLVLGSEISDSYDGYIVEYESMTKNGQELFLRDKQLARIFNNEIYGVSNDRSLILSFSFYDEFIPVIAHFQNIYLFTDDLREKRSHHYLHKLANLFENNREKFEEIKQTYISVFNDVIDMKYVYTEDERMIFKICHSNNKWISQSDISAGMQKTLNLIILLKTSKEGSVLLIDEIENSLGVNCLDVVVEELRYSNMFQSIITSHHPYVINNINFENWKVVSRSDSEIKVRKASELGIGDTSHEAFFQLINAFYFEEA